MFGDINENQSGCAVNITVEQAAKNARESRVHSSGSFNGLPLNAPVRQEITVIPADKPSDFKLGWVVYEEKGTVVHNDFNSLPFFSKLEIRWINFTAKVHNWFSRVCLFIRHGSWPKPIEFEGYGDPTLY